MRFEDELRDPAELDLPTGKQGVSEKELKMAERLVEAMVDKWDPDRYRDDYRVDVKELIERRVASGQLEAGPAEPAPRQPARGKVLDLMSLLKRSVEEGGRRPAASRAKAHAAPRRRASARRAGGAKRSA
jgi:DNA end-binding protein Ku